ncbi:signal transduction histidine kinase [Marinicella litoralis]|uniref:histidine kinase n=1 Tax=Marinicella litoralis TaxID=644220 RepID=A0A4R6XQJ6_9GAMM|nr:signal transduction histidine kinase [Marinicella litoralis]
MLGRTSQLIILCLFLVFSIQSAAVQFNHLSTSDGLKSSIIRNITKSHDGFVWIGTYKGLYQFDGYQLTQFMMPDGEPFNEVRSVVEDNDGHVWIATLSDGIFYYSDGVIVQYPQISPEIHGEFNHMILASDGLWIIYSKKIMRLNEMTLQVEHENRLNNTTYSAIDFDTNNLFLGTQFEVIKFNKMTAEYSYLLTETTTENRKKLVIHRDVSGLIWLGRSDGLYQYDDECQCFTDRNDILSGVEIYALASDDKALWIGTTKDGLFQYNWATKNRLHYEYNKLNPTGLKDNSIISLYSSDDMLWLGTFNNGLQYIDKKALTFGALSRTDLFNECLDSQVIYDIYEEEVSELWLATSQGVVLVDMGQQRCVTFQPDKNDPNAISSQLVYSFYSQDNGLWITGSNGIDYINLSHKKIEPTSSGLPVKSSYFMVALTNSKFLIGTSAGLYSYDLDLNESKTILAENGDEVMHQFYLYHVMPDQSYVFGTTGGLYQLRDDSLQKISIELSDGHEVVDITGMTADLHGGLLLAADEKYLFTVDGAMNVTDYSELIADGELQASVYEMIPDENGDFWMSSDNGIFKINLKNRSRHHFKETDGLQSNDFLKIASHRGQSGKIYFGGRQGFNAFYPEEISINTVPPKVVITEVSQLNKTINVGQQTQGGFVLNKPINQMESLDLGHKDLSIGFEFAALDFADSMRNQYAYRLLGFNDEWSYVGADNRQAHYTNLNPGNYTFQVKASNKDGVWNETPKSLSIKVYPAPWLSAWAYSAYILVLVFSIWAFIRYKTIASRKRAKQLEVTVAERTQEVVLQKRMVESLLDHKNEVFANVTHEFKTPLSLILGPTDQLADEPELAAYRSQLSMIQRNAKRLLLMVGQILKLSQAEQNKEVLRETQAVRPTLLMLYESFLPLAKEKEMSLKLTNEIDVNVYATAECVETVIGNLISNALKYAPKGGHIDVTSALHDGHICITVSDNGPGIREQDLGKIFNRFVRLDNHKNIQGTGIGLAVVKEVVEANNGYVKVTSEWGKGTQFSVTFPITQLNVEGTMSRVMTDQMVNNVTMEMHESTKPANTSKQSNAVSVLIIEDNLDMQKHTGDVLSDRFNCMFADRGELGIALALKEVPDIIICDVMMPGMDGYQVTRILRHDERTSHIPIILLTALNTKESRIKGWREKIDRYMTKPFDGTELNVQLDSMLSIRKLLQEKTNHVINNHDPIDSLDLSKQDLKFIEKLQDVIAQYHSNEYFQKADLADKMAVSERQLLRKVKALIGTGPLEMLRDYRLEQAKLRLKDGYQVGQVSVDCGFGSISYFGTCFKKKYGMTPKQYQQLD